MDEGSREIKRIIPVKSQAGSDKKDGRSGPRFYLFFFVCKRDKKSHQTLLSHRFFSFFCLPKSAETPQLWPSCLSSVFAINKQPFRLQRASCLLFSSSPFIPPRARAPAATTRRPQVRNRPPCARSSLGTSPATSTHPRGTPHHFSWYLPSVLAFLLRRNRAPNP
jgi:hypothetical protein